MVKAGLVDRGRPSMRALARKAQDVTGTNHPSVEATRRLVLGMVSSEPETVAAVAKALRVDVRTVTAWAGGTRTVAEPYRPPAEADLLTPKQRKAVDMIIRAMTDREESTHGAPTTRAGDAGASVTPIGELKPPTLEDIQEGRAAAHQTRGKKKGRQS
jgi:hypothetical protein